MKLSTGEWEGVVLSNAEAVNYFNSNSNSSHRLDYTREVVRPTIAVFYFKKHSIFTSMFNKKIYIFHEAGLISRWFSYYNHEEKSSRYRGSGKLNMTNISAILKISAVLYSISIFVFVLEAMSRRFERIRKCLDYLTY